MEQGNVACFKGMPLANVDVDMEVDESDIDGDADDENEAMKVVTRVIKMKQKAFRNK